jgi:hypothetical protein
MNVLNAIQSNVEPLMASMWGAKIPLANYFGKRASPSVFSCLWSVVLNQRSELR